MSQPTPVPGLHHEHRRHPRVQLNLPVRLRWLGPLGQLTEVTETLDVSRGGMFLYRREPCRPRALLWVTFPYDAAVRLAQPETPAHVVRVKQAPGRGYLVAVEFDTFAGQRATNARARKFRDFNRRRSERIPLALPIRIRPADSPWPEETMTIDVCSDGVLFCTTRLYAPGDPVRITLPNGALRSTRLRSRWALGAEVPARVVRIARIPGSVEQQVALALHSA